MNRTMRDPVSITRHSMSVVVEMQRNTITTVFSLSLLQIIVPVGHFWVQLAW